MNVGFGQNLVYALQLSLGAVFLLSAVPKLLNPRAFAQTVANYDVIGPRPSRVVAPGLIAVECFLAVSLLTGGAFELGLAVAAVTLVVFAVAITTNLRRGREIDCGCFGESGEQLSARSLVRVGALLAGIAVLSVTFMSGLATATTAAGLAAHGSDGAEYLIDVAGLAIVFLVTAAWLFVAPELVRVLGFAAGRPHKQTTAGGRV